MRLVIQEGSLDASLPALGLVHTISVQEAVYPHLQSVSVFLVTLSRQIRHARSNVEMGKWGQERSAMMKPKVAAIQNALTQTKAIDVKEAL
jgi:hypothetical protein